MKTLNATRPGEAANVEKIERPKEWPGPPDEVVVDDAVEVEVDGRKKVLVDGEWVDQERCAECNAPVVNGELFHEPLCPTLVHVNLPKVQDHLLVPKMKPPKEEPVTPKGYGELKVGMEGTLNGVPVKVRKITKKDIIMRPLNRTIRDKDGLMVSFKESKV